VSAIVLALLEYLKSVIQSVSVAALKLMFQLSPLKKHWELSILPWLQQPPDIEGWATCRRGPYRRLCKKLSY
jgi:hypothetical protein